MRECRKTVTPEVELREAILSASELELQNARDLGPAPLALGGGQGTWVSVEVRSKEAKVTTRENIRGQASPRHKQLGPTGWGETLREEILPSESGQGQGGHCHKRRAGRRRGCEMCV